MARVLGINAVFHDPAAALVVDGRIVAAAEAGTITGAARALNISQPSVSAAIAELEASFDLQLFVRHHAQGLSSRLVTPEELFHPSTLETFKI